MTMKVTPKIVSGRVVNISSFRSGALDVEEDLGAFRTADPVALDLLQRVAPLEPFQSVEHPLGVGRYAEQPLFHLLLFDGKAAAFGESVLHLVVEPVPCPAADTN